MVWLYLVVSFGAGFAAGSYHQFAQPRSWWEGVWKATATSDRQRATTQEQLRKLVTVTEWKLDRAGVVPKIMGILLNRSGNAVDVTVSFILYDRSGAQIDTAAAAVHNLKPGARGKFEAIIDINHWRDVAKAQLDELSVTGWR
ncbi:MAG: hypothetical protein HY235_13035 [Acidobacteria bacterium]|nr:hypothetical protein [Acidobacteriota bacterium]